METSIDDRHWVHELLEEEFEIQDITIGAMGGHAIRVRGRFLGNSRHAYEHLAPYFRARGHTLMFRHEEGEAVIYIMRGIVQPKPNNTWLPIILAAATVLSMLFSYTFYWGSSEPSWASFWYNLPTGLAATGTLLAILLAHEMGHYVTARSLGVAVTLPFLIPFPFSPFGTMGAVIRMKDIPPSRRAMLLIGAAGPLSGLIVALPLLIVGLSLSVVEPLPLSGGYVLEGNSLLYGFIKLLLLGRWLPSKGIDVSLHPVAFSAWAGLLVTSLNLIPAGQLDGGHIARALLGQRAQQLNWLIIGLLAVLGFLWQGWLLWAALIFLFSRRAVAPLDDVSPLTRREAILAAIMLLLFILAFTPVPLSVVPPDTWI